MITKPRWGTENCGDIPDAEFSWEVYCGELYWEVGIGADQITSGKEPVYILERQLNRLREKAKVIAATQFAMNKLTHGNET